MRNTFITTALQTVLLSVVLTAGTAAAQPICGDVNETDSVTPTDALAVLRKAVGQPVNLVCDRCGSTCVGDPRYLLGEWVFESDFEGEIFEDNYSLFAVDEANCEIVGEDLDDGGIVYAYAGEDYDYVLLDANETYCDVFLFDYVGPDEVEGFDVPYDLDVDGFCDFDAPFDEGTMIGDRLASALTGSSIAASKTGALPSSAKLKTRTVSSSLDLKPEMAALLERVKSNYARHRRH